MATVDELETEVDVFLCFKDETAKDEGSTIEAGDWYC